MKHSAAEWFAQNILQHEPSLRRWLRRIAGQLDLDDIVQETFAKIAGCDYMSIQAPRAFLFRVAHNIVMSTYRTQRVVPIASIEEIDTFNILDVDHTPEQSLLAREEVSLLKAAIASLPNRCQQVLTLRKIDGLSQREVAVRLHLSESTVEKHVAHGLRLCIEWIEANAHQPESRGWVRQIMRRRQ